MLIPIQYPFLERRNGNLQEMKAGFPCGSNVFPARSLVYLTGSAGSQVLAAIPTGGVALFGQAPAPSAPAVANPPYFPYNKVYPFALDENSLIVMSTTNAAGDSANAGTAASAPAISTIVVGQGYGILNPTTGPNKGIQQLNLDDTTNKLLIVVQIYPNQATTDQNGLVLCRVVPTCFQA